MYTDTVDVLRWFLHAKERPNHLGPVSHRTSTRWLTGRAPRAVDFSLCMCTKDAQDKLPDIMGASLSSLATAFLVHPREGVSRGGFDPWNTGKDGHWGGGELCMEMCSPGRERVPSPFIRMF